MGEAKRRANQLRNQAPEQLHHMTDREFRAGAALARTEAVRRLLHAQTSSTQKEASLAGVGEEGKTEHGEVEQVAEGEGGGPSPNDRDASQGA